MTERTELLRLCRDFILKNNISCAEAVYQMDRVMENAPEFIEGICSIVGYAKTDDEPVTP